MDPIRVGDVEADICRVCGCVWLDALELDRILAIKGAATRIDLGHSGSVRTRPELKPPRCPRDQTDLIEVADPGQSHICYESCRVCGGMLFDPGELTDLSEFTLRERVKSMLKL